MKQILTLFAAVFSLFTFGQSSQPESQWWIANNDVTSVVRQGNTVYLGGFFDYIGPIEPFGTAADKVTGVPNFNFINPNGVVYAAVSDGSGGWYIGGEFTQLGNATRNRLARINADGSLNAWNPTANNTVYALEVNGGIVYAGGLFSSAGGQSRSRIAALDATTGAATSWNPGANSTVFALEYQSGVVYAGGNFTIVNAQARNRLVAIDASTAIPTAWNPGANNTVRTLCFSSNRIYAGGDFTNLGGSTRNYLAAVNTLTGVLETWNPNANFTVNSIAVNGATVYVGGGFTSIAGNPRSKIAALNNTTGAPIAWDPGADGTVQTLLIDGTRIYAGGNFKTIGGENRSRIAVLDIATGVPMFWQPEAGDTVNAIAAGGSMVYYGGTFRSTGGERRNHIAALDATTGELTAWNPDIDSWVWALAIAGGKLYATGTFTEVGADPRSGIAAIDMTTGLATSWNPGLGGGNGMELTVDGDMLYVGGTFTSINALSRERLAAVDVTTGTVTSLNTTFNGQVSSIVIKDDLLYAAGDFSLVGGQPRFKIASIDKVSGAVSPWDPNPDDLIHDIVVQDNIVYAAGMFNNIGGQARSRVAAIEASTGLATPWNPMALGTASRLQVSGGKVILGGQFTSVGGQPRSRLAAVELATGLILPWNPNADASVIRALHIDGDRLYVGGDFTKFNGASREAFAVFDLQLPAITSFTPLTAGAGATVTITGINFTGTTAVTFGGIAAASFVVVNDQTINAVVGGGASGSVVVTTLAGTATLGGFNFCVPPAVIITPAGSTTFCEGGSVLLSSSSVSGNQWNLDGDPILSATGADYLATAGGTYTVTVTEAPGCITTSAGIEVVVNPTPAMPVISGNNTVCTGGTTTINSSEILGGSYSWFENGSPRAEITQSIVAGAGSFEVVVISAEGCKSAPSAPFDIFESGVPAAPFIDGVKNVCQFVATGEEVTYTVFPDPTVTSYTWVVPSTVEIVSGQGTGTLKVIFLNGFIQSPYKQLRVTGTTACGNTPMSIKYLAAQLPVTPLPITGSTNVCDIAGTPATTVYSVPLVAGATDYNWTLPAGASVVNDNGNSLEVAFSNLFVTSSIAVNAENACGVSGNRSLVVKKILPSTPGLINGSYNVCLFKPSPSNPAGVPATFSVTRAANVSQYNWSVSPGANITNHVTAGPEDVITVEFTAGFTTGSVSVTASNNCGVSAARTLAMVNYNPSTPGPVDVAATQGCPNRIYTYSLAQLPANATELVWTVPAGGNILFGQGTASIQVGYAGGPISGNVTATSHNGCATSSTRSIAVKLPACSIMSKEYRRTLQMPEGGEEEKLSTEVYPNPSISDFRFTVRSILKDEIWVRVIDVNGKAQTKMRVFPGETKTIGEKLRPGIYFIEVTQGKLRKVEKIVKL